MTSTKKTFAAITDRNFRVSAKVEIKDEKDAVQKTLGHDGISFTTYQIESVTLDGKELKGEPENQTPQCYVGIDRLYTRDDVIASMQAKLQGADQYMAQALKNVIGRYKEGYAADSVHITGLERPGRVKS